MSGRESLDNQNEAIFGQTPWQTVGPFFHFCLTWKGGADLTGQSTAGARADLILGGHDHLASYSLGSTSVGEPIELAGQVLDGAGKPVADAMLEFWHANGAGRYTSDFCTFGRCAVDDEGRFRFMTVRPGAVTDAHGTVHAPQISVGVFARGIIKRLLTRIYFDDAAENTNDPVLSRVPAARRHTLIARGRDRTWSFNVVLQGADETVFFRC
jgi:protocatechuate 3,4-dioxygenase, alpha subunit